MRWAIAIILMTLLALWAGRLTSKGLPEKRRINVGWLFGVVLVTLGVLLLARFGFHWLAVLGAGALATLRGVVPLLIKWGPWAYRLWVRKLGGPTLGSTEGGARTHRDQENMTREEALDVLGLRDGATQDQIVNAYRTLIKKVHPDSPGGSSYLAARLNAARKVLLDQDG